MDSYKLAGTKNLRQIYKGKAELICLTNNEICYLSRETSPKLRKITFPDGKDMLLNINFPGLTPYYDFDMSRDGKTIVYANNYLTAKYIIIDNLFK